MNGNKLAEDIQAKFGVIVEFAKGGAGKEPQFVIPKELWLKFAQFLRYEAGYTYFSFLTATDRKEKIVVTVRVERFSAYLPHTGFSTGGTHPEQFPENQSVTFSTEVYPEATLPSLVTFWKGADWMEREVFDLFGIKFEGHPNLVRILLPDEYQGFPLKKEFPLDQHYEPYR